MITHATDHTIGVWVRAGIASSCAFLSLGLAGDPALAQVTFSTPQGYSAGFRDYLNYLAGSSGTQTGPVAYVGNYGGALEPDTDDSTAFIRLTDDIDENGIPGSIVVVTIGPDGNPVLTTLTDFGDLHAFNIAFDRAYDGGLPNSGAIDALNVVWYGDDDEDEEYGKEVLADWQSAEALRMLDWYSTGIDKNNATVGNGMWPEDPNPPPKAPQKIAQKRRSGIGVMYGLRMIEREDLYYMHASGGILGGFSTETVADNHIMGPAIGLVWIKSYGPWTTRLQGLLSLGFNSGELNQSNTVGSELVPGATNRLLYAQPTNSYNQDSHDEFSPNGEIRAAANFRVTDTVTFAINWSGIAVDNALLADDRTLYYLPTMGLVDPGNQRLMVHHFFCGIEMVR